MITFEVIIYITLKFSKLIFFNETVKFERNACKMVLAILIDFWRIFALINKKNSPTLVTPNVIVKQPVTVGPCPNLIKFTAFFFLHFFELRCLQILLPLVIKITNV